jgi:hypothetical protein
MQHSNTVMHSNVFFDDIFYSNATGFGTSFICDLCSATMADNLDATLATLGLHMLPGDCVAMLRQQGYSEIDSFLESDKEDYRKVGLKYGTLNLIVKKTKDYVASLDAGTAVPCVPRVCVDIVKGVVPVSVPVSANLSRAAPPVGFGSALIPSVVRLENKRPVTDLPLGSFVVNYDGGKFVGKPCQDRAAVKRAMKLPRVEVKGVGEWLFVCTVMFVHYCITAVI